MTGKSTSEKPDRITPALSGIVLIGGASRRMGTDKASLRLGGESLLERTVRVLEMLSTDLLIVGHGIQSLDTPGIRRVLDEWPGHGPLGGIATGLSRAQHSTAIVVSCDLPGLRVGALRLLASLLLPGWDAVVPRTGTTAHPLHAVYSCTVHVEARTLLDAGERRLGALLDRIRVRWVSPDELASVDPECGSLTNVNTPLDWAEARARARLDAYDTN